MAIQIKRRPTFREGLNLNTVLLGIVVALSGWTLNRVQNLSERMAEITTKSTTTDRDLEVLRLRMGVAEAEIQSNSIALARLQQQSSK